MDQSHNHIVLNVAALSLCKELYELSGWGAPQLYKSSTEMLDWIQDDHGWHLPAYDLGHLLRRLPEFTRVWSHQSGFAASIEGDAPDGEPISCVADSPEDALCTLAIELFRQGALRRETA